MKIENVIKTRIVRSWNDTFKKIQTFGEFNDIPQQILELLSQSVTGYNCINTYKKFIIGKPIGDFWNSTITAHGQTGYDLLSKIAEDLAIFGGFYLHFNFTLNKRIATISHIPFECMRFKAPKDGDLNCHFDGYAYNPDWGYRRSKLHKSINDYTEFFGKFNLDDLKTRDIRKSKGQILYCNFLGSDTEYALPLYRAALTDLSTEAGLSNVSYRSVRNNFLTPGLLVDINGGEDETEVQENSLSHKLGQLQGDMNACKIAVGQVRSKDEMPAFIDFKAQNFDREFVTTNSTVKDRIGRAFSIPPVLRSEDVGNNFGATLVENSYHLYNATTMLERDYVVKILNKLNSLMENPFAEFSINPLMYKVRHNIPDIATLLEKEVISVEEARKFLELGSDDSVNQ